MQELTKRCFRSDRTSFGVRLEAAALIYLHARAERDNALTDALGAAMSGAQAPEVREESEVTNR